MPWGLLNTQPGIGAPQESLLQIRNSKNFPSLTESFHIR